MYPDPDLIGWIISAQLSHGFPQSRIHCISDFRSSSGLNSDGTTAFVLRQRKLRQTMFRSPCFQCDDEIECALLRHDLAMEWQLSARQLFCGVHAINAKLEASRYPWECCRCCAVGGAKVDEITWIRHKVLYVSSINMSCQKP